MGKTPLRTPGGFPGAAGLPGTAKGKLCPACRDGLRLSWFGELSSLCVPIDIHVQGNPAGSVLGVGLRRWGFIFQILICVKLIIISGLSSLKQRGTDICGWDSHCPARAKQGID